MIVGEWDNDRPWNCVARVLVGTQVEIGLKKGEIPIVIISIERRVLSPDGSWNCAGSILRSSEGEDENQATEAREINPTFGARHR